MTKPKKRLVEVDLEWLSMYDLNGKRVRDFIDDLRGEMDDNTEYDDIRLRVDDYNGRLVLVGFREETFQEYNERINQEKRKLAKRKKVKAQRDELLFEEYQRLKKKFEKDGQK